VLGNVELSPIKGKGPMLPRVNREANAHEKTRRALMEGSFGSNHLEIREKKDAF